VRFGTAGWTDPSLLKSHRFYPRGGTRAEARLRHYAKHFDLVEVDASYYTILEPARTQQWVAWTPRGFVFNVKAHASLTGHPVDLSRLPAQLRERAPAEMREKGRCRAAELGPEFLQELWLGFEASLLPLHAAGRLGSVLLQFPPWFTATRGSTAQLERLAERWQAFPLAVEFRHPSWLEAERRARVFDLMSRLGLAYVAVDEPNLPGGGVPCVLEVTQPELAVLRLHGQNMAGWHRGATVAQRFNYLYSKSELQQWIAPVQKLASSAKRVDVIFNNCVRDYAVVNAKGLSALLATLS
jgi:uncharacterized protein YecE (DUF72 family)